MCVLVVVVVVVAGRCELPSDQQTHTCIKWDHNPNGVEIDGCSFLCVCADCYRIFRCGRLVKVQGQLVIQRRNGQRQKQQQQQQQQLLNKVGFASGTPERRRRSNAPANGQAWRWMSGWPKAVCKWVSVCLCLQGRFRHTAKVTLQADEQNFDLIKKKSNCISKKRKAFWWCESKKLYRKKPQ